MNDLEWKDYIGIKQVRMVPMTAAKAARCLKRDIDTANADSEGNGYLVQYDGGYTSWAPKEVADKAYRLTSSLTFGLAREALLLGHKLAREGWNGNGMYIKAQFPDKNSKMTFPYIYITVPGCTEGTRLLPWQPAQVDFFSDDWSIIED